MPPKNKSIGDMTPSERGHLFPIIHETSTPAWRDFFREEKKRILDAVFLENIERINHIGSTAVPGLLAKPTVDILLEIKASTNLEELIDHLKAIGYLYESKPMNPAPGMMFMKGYTPQGFQGQAVHLHVRYLGDWDELYFRDYLKKHPETLKAYAEMKTDLKKRYEFDREAYTNGKTAFCREITSMARQELGPRYVIPKKKLFQRLVSAEVRYPGLFSPSFHTPWGVYFLNPSNPTSHDSNHAVITHGRNYPKIVKEVMALYDGHQVAPRIYGCYRKNQLERMEPLLTSLNFAIEKSEDRLMIHQPGQNRDYPHRLVFRRQYQYDETLFRQLYEPHEWAYALPVQKVAVESPRFHIFVGFLNETPVVTSTISDFGNGLYRLDDVETVVAYRKQGYAREMLSFLVNYFEENIRGLLYLWVVDPSAQKIYEEVGFKESHLLKGRWSAYRK